MTEKAASARRRKRSVAGAVFGLLVVVPLAGCVTPTLPEMPGFDTLVNNLPLMPKSPVRPAGPVIAQLVPQASKERFQYGRPLVGFTTANFVGSYNCAVCHDNLVDRAGADVSIGGHWRSTMMANAAKDPLWQAKVQSEVKRNPALTKVIEEKCATCHMPMAWTQAGAGGNRGRYEKSGGIFSAFLRPGNELHAVAMDGVSCSLCHQIQDDGLGTARSFSGKYTIDTGMPAPRRPIFGPYRNPFVETMATSVGYTPKFGPQMNDAAFCGVCHTLFTPYVDAAGQVAGEFPEQTVYLEWLHSAFGEPLGERREMGDVNGAVRLCQDCHMPHSKTGGVVVAKPADKEVPEREHFSMHHFVGGNVFMMNILMDYSTPLQISASTEKLEQTRGRTLTQLQKNTARLSLMEPRFENGILATAVRVDNLAGHKFPSGFPSRRAWIYFAVLDGNGETLFESGQPKLDGSVVGDDADAGVGVESHYDLIASPDQVQIYEGVMRDSDGGLTFTLLRGAGYLKDNRLLPAGFDKTNAGPDIAVYGDALRDSNFQGGTDLVNYRVDTAGRPGPFTVRAVLYYTPLSYAFMQDLRVDTDLEAVARFWQYYKRADKQPVAVAAAETRVR